MSDTAAGVAENSRIWHNEPNLLFRIENPLVKEGVPFNNGHSDEVAVCV